MLYVPTKAVIVYREGEEKYSSGNIFKTARPDAFIHG